MNLNMPLSVKVTKSKIDIIAATEALKVAKANNIKKVQVTMRSDYLRRFV
jgi:ribonuclease HI